MEEKTWYMLSMTFRWPHQGMMVGFETFEATEEEPYNTVKMHFLLVTINYEFGWGDSPYE